LRRKKKTDIRDVTVRKKKKGRDTRTHNAALFQKATRTSQDWRPLSRTRNFNENRRGV